MATNKEEIFLENIITETLLVNLPRLTGKDVNMQINIDCNLPSALLGDRNKVSQILKNVLDHAIVNTLKGDISLQVVKQKHSESSDFIGISFKFGEMGEVKPVPFDQADIERMVGEIDGTAIFEYGSLGNLVIVNLLFEKAGDSTTLLEKTDAPKLAGKRVLLLSEDEAMTESLGYLFYSLGMDAVFVNSTSEVLHKLEKYAAKDQPFDLLICDTVNDNMGMLNIAHKYKQASLNTVGLLMVATYNGNYLKANDIIEVGSLEFIDRLVIPSEYIGRMCYFLGNDVPSMDDWNMDNWDFENPANIEIDLGFDFESVEGRTE